MAFKIGIIGSPGSGKTTIASKLFSMFKEHGIEAEYASEVAREELNKNWCIEHPAEQYYILKKQREKEDILPSDVEVVVTDSPTLLIYYYALWNCPDDFSTANRIIVDLYSEFLKDKYRYNMLIFLNRIRPYEDKGARIQDEDQANMIAVQVRSLLDSHKVYYMTMDGDSEAAEKIFRLYMSHRID